MLDFGVAHLEREAPHLSLRIADTGLDLDRHAAMSPEIIDEIREPRVPGPSIADDRQGYLEPDRDAGMHAGAESFDDSDLSGVTEGVRSRIRPDPDIQAHDGPDPCELHDAGGCHKTTFKPADLGARYARGVSHGPDRQSPIDSRLT